jgi:hypothetical protein
MAAPSLTGICWRGCSTSSPGTVPAATVQKRKKTGCMVIDRSNWKCVMEDTEPASEFGFTKGPLLRARAR